MSEVRALPDVEPSRATGRPVTVGRPTPVVHSVLGRSPCTLSPLDYIYSSSSLLLGLALVLAHFRDRALLIHLIYTPLQTEASTEKIPSGFKTPSREDPLADSRPHLVTDWEELPTVCIVPCCVLDHVSLFMFMDLAHV